MQTLGKYGKVYDKNNGYWLVKKEDNYFYLKARQQQLNDMLRARGHLFLNEVYDVLGFPRTMMGCIVGWMYRPGVHVDFNLPKLEEITDTIPLSFNVDGIIYDKIEEEP